MNYPLLILGTAPTGTVKTYLETQEAGSAEALLVKAGREGDFADFSPGVETYSGHLGPGNKALSRTMVKVRPGTVVIIAKGGWAHNHAAHAVDALAAKHELSLDIRYSVDGEPSLPASPDMLTPGQPSHQAPVSALATMLAPAVLGAGALALAVGPASTLAVPGLGLAAEAWLRLRPRNGNGHGPRLPKTRSKGTITAYDPQLGWIVRPGAKAEFVYTLDDGRSHGFAISIDAQGCRAARPDPESRDGGPEIWITGGSPSFGWGVDDQDCFAWKLQNRFSGYRIRNFSAPRYSLFQMLLTLERRLPQGEPPRAVILFFSPAHPDWNTGRFADMKTLDHLFRPTCASIKGKLRRRPPDSYLTFPGTKALHTVKALERGWNRMRFQGRDKTELKRATCEHLLLQIRKRCEQAGTELVIVCSHDMPDWYAFLKKTGFSWTVSGVDYQDPAMTLEPFDSHAGPLGHDQYAMAAGDALDDLFAGRMVSPGLDVMSRAGGPAQGVSEDLYPLF